MQHFIAYHNTEKMGRRLHEGYSGGELSVSTNKPVQRLVGNCVWFIAGEGAKPRQYTLASVFRVTEVGDDDGEFKHFASGPGHIFETPVDLSDFPWFAKVLQTTGNFGLGVQEMKDREVINELLKHASLSGWDVTVNGVE